GEGPSDDAPPPTVAAPKAMTVDEVAAQIKKLETKLDRMIQRSRKKSPADVASQQSRNGTDAHAAPLAVQPDAEIAAPDDGEVVSSDYYDRQWGRTAMRDRAEDVDDFGKDPVYAARVQPFFDFLYKHYFRVDTVGAANIPSEGRCLIVSNHS